jgi:hypothetical protein
LVVDAANGAVNGAAVVSQPHRAGKLVSTVLMLVWHLHIEPPTLHSV